MLFDKVGQSLAEAVKAVQEKAVSQAQQKLMAMALAYKRGEMSDEEASDKVKQIANSMSEKDLEDFAKTKHDEVPAKKDEGNAFTKALNAAKENGDKTFTVAGKKYDVKTEQELDTVNKKALKKDFDDRKDKDIDNDGDVDDSDEYLHNRRKAVSKAVKEDTAEEELEEATKKAKEGPDAAGQEKLEPRAKGEKDFADKHEVETKDGAKEEEENEGTKAVKKAPENKVKSVREALMDIWSQ